MHTGASAGGDAGLQTASASRGDVQALLAALAARGLNPRQQSEQMIALARAVAQRMALNDDQVEMVAEVALLHDVGKIGMPDSLLHKQEQLTERERELLCEHALIGAQIIASMPGLAHLEAAVRAKHERWDGTGYPDGLATDGIPVASRITFACESYLVMLSDRPYRAALSRDVALKVLEFNSGSQFCPETVGALFEVLGAGSPRDLSAGPASVAAAVPAPAPAAVPARVPPPEPEPEPEPEPVPEAAPAPESLVSRPPPPAPPPPPPPAPRRRPPAGRTPLHERRHWYSASSPAITLAHGFALVGGVALGLVLALPLPDVKREHLCPPAHEGLVQCQLQKQWLPTITVVLGVALACFLLVHLLLVQGPSLWRRYRANELWRRERPPPFESDPVLRAATWGLTYEDANPGGRRPKRVWKDAEGRPMP